MHNNSPLRTTVITHTYLVKKCLNALGNDKEVSKWLSFANFPSVHCVTRLGVYAYVKRNYSLTIFTKWNVK